MTYSFLPAENNAMTSLLEIIKDPKSAQKRLDELNKVQSDINSTIEKNKVSETAAKELHAAAEKAKSEAESIRKQNEETTSGLHQQLKEKIDHYDKALKDHHEASSKQISELNQQQKDQAAKETHISAKHAELSSWQDALSKRETDLVAREKAHAEKVARLQAAL